jgi:hypothetical protein
MEWNNEWHGTKKPQMSAWVKEVRADIENSHKRKKPDLSKMPALVTLGSVGASILSLYSCASRWDGDWEAWVPVLAGLQFYILYLTLGRSPSSVDSAFSSSVGCLFCLGIWQSETFSSPVRWGVSLDVSGQCRGRQRLCLDHTVGSTMSGVIWSPVIFEK